MQARTLSFAKQKEAFLDISKGGTFKKSAQSKNTYAKRNFSIRNSGKEWIQGISVITTYEELHILKVQ